MNKPEPDSPTGRRPAQDLSGKQKRQLRALAHHLEPVVQVGKDGATGAVLDAVDTALADHELIKVRVLETSPEGRGPVGVALAERLGAHLVGELGRIVILYRRHPNQPKVPLTGR